MQLFRSAWLLLLVVGNQSQHVLAEEQENPEAKQPEQQEKPVEAVVEAVVEAIVVPTPLEEETTTTTTTATTTTTTATAGLDQSPDCDAKPSVLVVGATGATGRHVVQYLLNHDHKVSVIVRSKQRMLDALETKKEDLLSITETPSSILDLTDDQVLQHVQNVDVVVSCLGHTLDFQGIFGEPRRLVTDTIRRLTTAAVTSATSNSVSTPSLKTKKKIILMTSDGVAHPDDTPRPWYHQGILYLIRHLVNPHADNEDASAYLLHEHKPPGSGENSIEWIVARPTSLTDDELSTYSIQEKPGVLFGPQTVSRKNTAKFIVDLIEIPELWDKYKFRMPVVHDADHKGKPQ